MLSTHNSAVGEVKIKFLWKAATPTVQAQVEIFYYLCLKSGTLLARLAP